MSDDMGRYLKEEELLASFVLKLSLWSAVVTHKCHTIEILHVFAPGIPASVSTAHLGCTFEAPSFRNRKTNGAQFVLKCLMIKWYLYVYLTQIIIITTARILYILEATLKFKIHSASDASCLHSGRIKQQNIYPILHPTLWLTSRFCLSHQVVPSQTTAMKLAWDAALVSVGHEGWTRSICLLM